MVFHSKNYEWWHKFRDRRAKQLDINDKNKIIKDQAQGLDLDYIPGYDDGDGPIVSDNNNKNNANSSNKTNHKI